MHPNTIKKLAIVFFLLVGVVFYPAISEKVGTKFAGQKASELSFTPFTKDKTDKVTLILDTDAVDLVRDNSMWKVASYSASLDKIDSLFLALNESTMGPLVSQNPDNFPEYGIATEGAVLMILEAGGTKKTVHVGKSGPTVNSYYAKAEGSNNVYLVTGGVKDILSAKTSDWRDKSIVRISPELITRVTVVGPRGFNLDRSDNKWTLSASGVSRDIPDSEVSPIVSSLSGLIASDFYTDEEALVKSKAPKNEVTVIDKDAKTIAKLTIYPDDAYYLVTVEGKTDNFKVAGYHLDDLFKLFENGK